MDRNGLLTDIMTSVEAIYQGRQGLDTDGGEREGRISYQKGLALAIDTFREIQKSAAEGLELLLLAEYVFLGQELQCSSVQDAKAHISLTRAMEDFDGAFLALEVLRDAAVYKSAEKTYSRCAEFRYKGMPKDAFHVACVGHKTRIDNILKSPGIHPVERNLLKQRLSNVITAQSVYLEKQTRVLKDNL